MDNSQSPFHQSASHFDVDNGNHQSKTQEYYGRDSILNNGSNTLKNNIYNTPNHLKDNALFTNSGLSSSSSSHSNQNSVDQQNEKRVGKLMKNLNILDAISQNLNSRIDKEQQELAERTKRIQKRQQDQNSNLEQKVSQLNNQKQQIKFELDAKESKINIAKDNTINEQQNLLNLKLQQTSLVKKLQQDNEMLLKQKDQTLKQLNKDIEEIKQQIKLLRQQIRDIEDEDDSYEDRKLVLNLQLNSLNDKLTIKDKIRQQQVKQVQQLQQDKEQQKQINNSVNQELQLENSTNQELEDKLTLLKHTKEGLIRESNKAPQNRNEVDGQLEQLKINNQKQMEQNRYQQQQLIQNTQEKQNNQEKNEEYNNNQAILKLQAKFERLHREIISKINKLEIIQKKQNDQVSLNIKQLKQLQQDHQINNQEIQSQTIELNDKIQQQMQQTANLKDDIRIVSLKVNNKNYYELKYESLNTSYQKLISYQDTLNQQYDESEEQEIDCQEVQRKMTNWLQKMKTDLQYDNQNQQDINQDLITTITRNLKDIVEKSNKLNQQLLQHEITNEQQFNNVINVKQQLQVIYINTKNIQNNIHLENTKLENTNKKMGNKYQDNEVSFFQIINKFLKEQEERLNRIKIDEIIKLNENIKSIDQSLKQLNDQFTIDKSNEKKNQLQDFEKQLEEINKQLIDFDDRIQKIQDEIAKVDLQDDSSKLELQRQLQQLLKNQDECRKQKDKLFNQIKQAKELTNDELQDYNIESINDNINILQDKSIPSLNNDIFELEKLLKKQLNQKRNQKQKQFYQQIDKSKSMLGQLNSLLEQIDQEIKRIDKSATIQLQCYNYQDLERSEEADQKIYQELVNQKEQQFTLKQNKDNLQKRITEIETNINDFQNKNEAEQQQQDVLTQQWQNKIEKTKQVNSQIQDEIYKCNKQLDSLDSLNNTLNNLTDKFRNKDKTYKECQEQQKLKQEKIDEVKQNIQDILNNLNLTNEQIQGILVPQDDNIFDMNYKEKIRKYQQNNSRVSQLQDKTLNMQFKLDEICKDLSKLFSQKITQRDLQQILDDLNRLELDLEYHQEDVNIISIEASDLLKQTNALLEQNRKMKIEDAEKALKGLQTSIFLIEDKFRELENKLDEYQQKIKEGMRDNIANEEVMNELKILKKEAEGIEKEINEVQRKRSQLQTQERILKDKLNQMKQSKSKSTVKELDELTNIINEHNSEANEFLEELNIKSDDLDERIIQLEQFLQKHCMIQNLQKELDQILMDINRNLLQETKRFDEVSDLQDLLRNVLLEMEKGTNNDYKLKEGFIKTELEELQDIEDIIFTIDENRQSISVTLQILSNDKSKQLMTEVSGNQVNNGQDPDQLQQMISEAIELQEKLNDSERQAGNCMKRLQQIRKDIGIADIPELIQQREKEIQEFSSKIRKLESEYNDIKKSLIGSNPQKEVQQELIDIENQLKNFREERANALRIFGADLQIFLPMPQKLHDLKLLKETIKKVRELGELLQKDLESIDVYSQNAVKLKRKIGGMDIDKRLKDLENREDDQRTRLEKLRKRFEVIGRGAADCDGYTSNTEEATFIDTLLAELPEMLNKQKGSIEDCDYIQGQIYEIKREVNKQGDQTDRQQQFIKESIDQVEDNVDLNEKSVVFLEKLADKLEDHFLSMDVKKKLDKRQLELQELQTICEDFAEKLLDMQEHLLSDIEKIDQKTKIQNPLQDLLVDENGNPVNLLEELIIVSDELKEILNNVSDLQNKNDDIRRKRQATYEEFQEQILRNSPYKGTGSPSKINNKADVFTLLKANGWMKKKIIDMIKQLKEVSKRMRENKSRYQDVRNKLERQAPRKLYKAVKGDMVDELFADYINRLNCPVPIKRLGNNQYTFGTKKIFAKIINGKLVIRVGGGYMGIEEFMMYYGQQELQKLQKEEMAKIITEGDAADEYGNLGGGVGSGLLDEEFLTDDENDASQWGRKSKGVQDIDIDHLKKNLKDNSARKSKNFNKLNKSFGSDHEEQKANNINTIVGIGDVRKALKKNVFQIQTYEEGKSGQKPKKGQQINISSNQVEKELKQIEKKTGTTASRFNANNLSNRMSPRREKVNSQYSDSQSSTTSNMQLRQQQQQQQQNLLTPQYGQASHSSSNARNINTNMNEKERENSSSAKSKFVSKIPQIKK